MERRRKSRTKKEKRLKVKRWRRQEMRRANNLTTKVDNCRTIKVCQDVKEWEDSEEEEEEVLSIFHTL